MKVIKFSYHIDFKLRAIILPNPNHHTEYHKNLSLYKSSKHVNHTNTTHQ